MRVYVCMCVHVCIIIATVTAVPVSQLVPQAVAVKVTPTCSVWCVTVAIDVSPHPIA